MYYKKEDPFFLFSPNHPDAGDGVKKAFIAMT